MIRLAEMEQRLSDVVFKAVPQRIASALLALGRADQGRRRWPFGPAVCEVRLTHEQLAELVGTSRETITKVLGELRGQGLIELRRGKVALLDLTALEVFAEANSGS
jgi:CRP/FNR family cyclic AMP-dependent transcriptional regulator